jgi:hypothetical protein
MQDNDHQTVITISLSAHGGAHPFVWEAVAIKDGPTPELNEFAKREFGEHSEGLRGELTVKLREMVDELQSPHRR